MVLVERHPRAHSNRNLPRTPKAIQGDFPLRTVNIPGKSDSKLRAEKTWHGDIRESFPSHFTEKFHIVNQNQKS